MASLKGLKSGRGGRTKKTIGTSNRKHEASGRSDGRSTGEDEGTTASPDERDGSILRRAVCAIFSAAASHQGVAGQRKLVVQLRKIQVGCCYASEDGDVTIVADTDAMARAKASARSAAAAALARFDESDFGYEIGRCVRRVLVVRRGEPAADRLVRFIGAFVGYAAAGDGADGEPDQEDTPTGRLATGLLTDLVRFVAVRDKTVRFRATQLVGTIVNAVDAIDEPVFRTVRASLIRRLRDREAGVRVQAVLALGRLAGSALARPDDSSDSDDDGDTAVAARLLEMVQHDPSGDVRRTLVVNVPASRATAPFLLERARDTDPATRRAVYGRVVPALSTAGDRLLSATRREKLLRWGLRDRDDRVRRAASRLFSDVWVRPRPEPSTEQADGAETDKAEEDGPAAVLEAVIELLGRIDVVNCADGDDDDDGGVAGDAMTAFWTARPDIVAAAEFPPAFWADLSAERVFLVRSYAAHCRASADSRISTLPDDKLPELSRLASLIRALVAAVISDAEKDAAAAESEDESDDDSAAVEREFCLEQMLQLVLLLDCSDEMGRRQLFAVVRDALAMASLPDRSTDLAMEAVWQMSGAAEGSAAAEREFCGLVMEALAEVHDAVDGPDEQSPSVAGTTVDPDGTLDVDNASFHSARSTGSTPPDRAVREMVINLKCLHMAAAMLRLLRRPVDQNSHVAGLIQTLVVPAVRSRDAPIRERGLDCLGLCCLLSEPVAADNIALFLRCFSKGHPGLQERAVTIVADILLAHPSLVEPINGGRTASPVAVATAKMLARALQAEDAGVQTTAAAASAKLLLTGALPDGQSSSSSGDGDSGSGSITDTLLAHVAVAYFDPASPPAVRQTLAYFLPVFCRSRQSHADRMATISVDLITTLLEADDSDEEEEDYDDDSIDQTGSKPTSRRIPKHTSKSGPDEQSKPSPAAIVGQIADWTDPRRLVNLVGLDLDGRSSSEIPKPSAHFVLASEAIDRLITLGPNVSSRSRTEKRALVTLLSKLWFGSAIDMVSDESSKSNRNVDRMTGRNLVKSIDELVDRMKPNETVLKNGLIKVSKTIEGVIGDSEDETDDEDVRTVVEVSPVDQMDEDDQMVESTIGPITSIVMASTTIV